MFASWTCEGFGKKVGYASETSAHMTEQNSYRRNLMNLKRSWLAVPAVLGLALTACSSGSTGSSDNFVTVNGSEPQNPLIPANTNETGGGRIVSSIFSSPAYYAADGSTQLDAAESITPNADNTEWTIKLRHDGKFSDGTPVLAKNFVEAWKMATKENLGSASFFASVIGTDDDGAGDMEGGLQIVDDYTFVVKLKGPESDFMKRLGYTAYSPLPDSTLADPKKGGEHPVGNGPYMANGENAWQHSKQIDLAVNPNYSGPRAAKNNGIRIVFYQSLDAAYADLSSDNLDVLDGVPSSVFSSYQQELSGRTANQPAAVIQYITIPERLEHFSGEEGKLRRKAISMSIDRDSIVKTVFSGTRTPAKDFTSPAIDGYKEGLKGSEVLEYNPTKAKELWEQANAISPWSGKFLLSYNSDGGHQQWVDATCNSIKNTLGIEAEGDAYADFKSLLGDMKAGTTKGAFRQGWQGDYPSLYNFLFPTYSSSASSNYSGWKSSQFDKYLSDSLSASSTEALDLQYKAEELLFEDMPVIPTWYANTNGAWSTKVSNVQFTWNSNVQYFAITKN